jgi:hypothetical protein
MGEETHSDDIRNVNEGDEVVLKTTNGDRLVAECTGVEVQHADPRSGEIRETRLWFFESRSRNPVVSIVDGLRSSDDDPEFPLHKEAWDMEKEQNIGYIESVEIRGTQVKA